MLIWLEDRTSISYGRLASRNPLLEYNNARLVPWEQNQFKDDHATSSVGTTEQFKDTTARFVTSSEVTNVTTRIEIVFFIHQIRRATKQGSKPRNDKESDQICRETMIIVQKLVLSQHWSHLETALVFGFSTSISSYEFCIVVSRGNESRMLIFGMIWSSSNESRIMSSSDEFRNLVSWCDQCNSNAW